MTVDELMTKLNRIVASGYGHLDVTTGYNYHGSGMKAHLRAQYAVEANPKDLLNPTASVVSIIIGPVEAEDDL